ncbi:MAG: 3-deoxy-manno-octulosonate cytidylyltransferase [Fidelibacterota bacterium]
MPQISDGKVLGVIPARYRSSRFPGKVLALLDGLPMVARVYARARESRALDSLVVATDSFRVMEALKGLDIPVVMTSRSHRSGTERVAEVAGRSPGVRLVVNIQGDEPLVDPRTVDAVVDALSGDTPSPMATAGTRRFRHGDWSNPQVVKVRVDENGFATDFFRRGPGSQFPEDCLKHVGLYGYQKNFLLNLAQMEPAPREKERDLEQMRALEGGIPVRVVSTNTDSLGVNTPRDLDRIREIMGIA